MKLLTSLTQKGVFSYPGQKVVKLGNILLSEDEEALLMASQDFAVFANMNDELHAIELLESSTGGSAGQWGHLWRGV